MDPIVASAISLTSLILTVVFGIIAVISNERSLQTARQANRIQDRLLQLEKSRSTFEIRKGEILLLGLFGRYFTVLVNRWELNGKWKADKLSFHQYLSALGQIDRDFYSLITNPFLVTMLLKYPWINKLWISLRFSIIEMQQDQEAKINLQTFQLFCECYDTIKNEITAKSVLDDPFYTTVDEAIQFLQTELPNITN
jgi:hypothetical protein